MLHTRSCRFFDSNIIRIVIVTEEGEQPLDVDLMVRAFGNKTEDRTSLGYTGTQTKPIFRSNQFEEDFDLESCRFEENAHIILTVSSEQD